MIIFDIILLIFLSGFVFYGLFYGLIRTAGSLVGVVVGAWLASRWYLPVYDWAENLFMGHEYIGKVATFIVLFTIINRLVCFIFAIINKIFHLIAIIPFLKTINRLGGAVLGFLFGATTLGLILFVASRYTLIDSLIGKWMVGSKVAPFLVKFVDVLKPLLPEMLKKLESII